MRIERALCNKTSSRAAMSTKRSGRGIGFGWDRSRVVDSGLFEIMREKEA